jgi:hypothetical protein
MEAEARFGFTSASCRAPVPKTARNFPADSLNTNDLNDHDEPHFRHGVEDDNGIGSHETIPDIGVHSCPFVVKQNYAWIRPVRKRVTFASNFPNSLMEPAYGHETEPNKRSPLSGMRATLAW